MARKRISMDEWIQEQLNGSDTIAAVSCYHKEGSKETEVWSIRFQEGEKVNALDVANILRRKAETHVQGLSGYQQFFLYVVYPNKQEFGPRLPFSVENVSDVAYGTTEEPTPEGRTRQAMRHGEAGFQIFYTQSTNLHTIQNVLLKQMSEERSKLLQESMDAVSVLKELALEMAKSQHQYKMEELKYLRESKMYESIARLGPSLVNTITGREVIPQSAADSALLEALIDNVTPDQIQSIAKILPPEVQGILATRAAEHWKKKNEAEETAIKALNGKPDAILDS